ncbi:MAG: YceI family protein [Cyclobacteriaceae bacterium]|nr:YceI family protein [Cyclobacteriaceae bacterium]
MKFILFGCLLIVSSHASGQKYISEKSSVTFFSKASIEDISARNEKSMCLLDTGTGDIAFSIPIKEFLFEKSLMQEHFNEKYMESDKFPKSTFQGKLTGFSMTGTGSQPVVANGKLTIHGVTRDVEVTGTFVMDQQIIMAAKFVVKLEDYQVKIPQLLWKNIAESVEVSVDFTLKPYEK